MEKEVVESKEIKESKELKEILVKHGVALAYLLDRTPKAQHARRVILILPCCCLTTRRDQIL